MKNLGFFGSTIRLTLLLINVLFLIAGIALLILACILKWGTSLTDFLKIDKLEELIKVGSLSTVSTILLILSVFIILLSFLGFLGIKLMNKFLMIVHEVVVILVFLTHLVSVLVVVFAFPTIEKGFKREFNATIEDLNKNGTSPDDFKTKCQISLDLSKTFKCCGFNGPSDFTQPWLVKDCCDKDNDYKDGCTEKILKSIKGLTTNLTIIPSVILLVIEFFSIVMTPILICKKNAYKQ